MAKQKMTEEELLSLIAQHEKASLGSQVAAGATISTTSFPNNSVMTTLEVDRFNSLNAYFGRPLGNEVENRSQIVLPELRDTVEWIVPQLMRMFAAAKTVCRFEPENQNDESQAELETLVVNHQFMQDNNGVILLQDFFKDALLMRNGYAEVFTEEATEVVEQSYRGLSEIQVAALVQDKKDEKVEVLEQREYLADVQMPMPQVGPQFVGQPQPPMPPLVQQVTQFDLKIRRTKKVMRTKVICLPPEEMRVSPQTRGDMEDCPFACHLTVKPRSDLIAQGYGAELVNSLRAAPAGTPEWFEMDALARDQVVDQLSMENPSDHAMEQVRLNRVVMRVDFDGDGIAELRRIVVGGDKIIENEVIEETPFVSCTPKRMPHRHTGISMYDEVMDLQIIKTVLFRSAIDNLTIANNGRLAVDSDNVNIDDLLTSRPGGVVRGRGPPANWIAPLEQPSNLTQQVLPMLGYFDELKTMRTGIGKQMMSPDPDDLQNVTKGAQMAAVSAAALKVEMIARLLAEGVKRMFQKIHGELRRNQDKPMWFQLSGKWLEVDPSKWDPRSKVSVNVGLGSGNQEEMRANLMLLGQVQNQLGQLGLVGPQQAYDTFKLWCEALGFQSPERFAMDPSSAKYAQHMQQMQQMAANAPPAPQVQAAQIKAKTTLLQQQAENERAQAQQQQELMEGRIQLVHEAIQAKDEQIHDAHQAHREAAVTANTTESQNQTQIVLALIKAFAGVIASQDKGNPDANPGEQMTEDIKTADNGLLPLLQGLHETMQKMAAPKVATFSDGRQIRIEHQDTIQ